MQNPNSSDRSPEKQKTVKAILDTFAQLAPELKATLVSEDPAVVTLDYTPVPLGFEKPENEAERKYKLVLDIVRDNLDLLGREPSSGHHFHETHEGVHHHDGHHGHGEEAAGSIARDPRDLVSEVVTRATGRFFEISAELARLALRNIAQSIDKTPAPKTTTLSNTLIPAWKERHLTKAGATDVRDCRELTSENGEIIYLMPASEYREKVASKGLRLKDKKIREATRRWVEDIHRISPEDTTEEHVDEMMAALALRGETMYLVPILSGLKPAGFESCGLGISRASLPMLERLSQEIPDQIQVLKMTEHYHEHGFSRDQLLIYNPSTVDSLLKQYPGVFSALGIAQGTHSYNLVEQVLVRYNLANDEMTPEYSKAVGLLLGYDEYSIDNYDKPKKDRPDGKWEPHSYHFNEKPLCIWGVDYSIADPETNKDYQAQLKAYEGLQKWIEQRLEEAEKPYEVLRGIPVYKEHADTSARIAGTLN